MPVAKPAKRRLREYQRRALRYELFVRHPALFMQMRLGKTLVEIRRILLLRSDNLRVLVVAPYDALSTWEMELELEGERDVAWLTGPTGERRARLHEGHRWNLFNKEGFLHLPEVVDVSWDAVVLDESTFIKNPKSKVSKFYTTHFEGVPHRAIMSGLPNPESDLDFFQQFAFLNRGYTLKSRNFWQFRAKWFTPMSYEGMGYDEWVPQPGALDFIRQRVGETSFILKRKDVNLDNPRVYERRVLELPPKLRAVYRKAEREFILTSPDGAEVADTTLAVTQHNWLRQLCGGFIDGKQVWDGKVRVILDLLGGELKNERVVVWAHYNQELEAVSETLRTKGIPVEVLRGLTPQEKRRDIIRAFQRGGLRVLAVQPAAVRYGVDLSAASTSIYYSTPLSNEIRTQSEDRILKVGDNHPLLYLDLAVKDSVDEDCLDLVKHKVTRSAMTLWLCNRAAERRRRG